MRKSHGELRGSRSKLRRKRSTPPLTPSRMLQEFQEGEKVVIRLHPSVQEGRPHHRFNGRVGTVVGKQGDAYIVSIRDGEKEKVVYALPIHLRRVEG